MLVEGIRWEDVVHPFNPEHVTPAGYDFSAKSFKRIGTQGEIFRDSKTIPVYFDVQHERYSNGIEKDMYYFGDGSYIVTFNERVRIPAGMTGLMWSRSTLLRCGANLDTAIWDAGYEGVGSSLLTVHNQYGLRIQQDARIGHMILVPIATIQDGKLYNGSYQREGIA